MTVAPVSPIGGFVAAHADAMLFIKRQSEGWTYKAANKAAAAEGRIRHIAAQNAVSTARNAVSAAQNAVSEVQGPKGDQTLKLEQQVQQQEAAAKARRARAIKRPRSDSVRSGTPETSPHNRGFYPIPFNEDPGGDPDGKLDGELLAEVQAAEAMEAKEKKATEIANNSRQGSLKDPAEGLSEKKQVSA